MTCRLLLSRSPGETRVALVSNERLIDYEVRRDHAPRRLDGIYLARLRKITGDGRLAFADIGGVEVMADLDAKRARAAGWSLTEGALVPVQIAQEPRRGRLARATTRLGLIGPRLVFLPHAVADGVSHRFSDAAEKDAVATLLPRIERSSGGFVARRGARGASLDILQAEARALMTEWVSCRERFAGARSPGVLLAPPAPGVGLLRDTVDAIPDEVVSDDRAAAEPLAAFCRTFLADAAAPGWIPVVEMAGAFDDLEEQIDAALSRRVAVPEGGTLTIERTEGMTVIDIDSGAAFEGTSLGRGAQQLNRRAAYEVASQLRLRAIGGLIAVDLVGSPRGKAGGTVLAAYRDAFRGDPARAEVD
ncbi:MAG: ribonuclease E/G, partial [Bauldia litoralis]